jgi:hypothetical protein
MPCTGGVACGQALQRLGDRLGLARQVDDQRPAADHRHLARQDGRGHEGQADLAHLLAEARHHLVRHRQRGLGRHVARRRAGAAGGQHQVAAHASTSSHSAALICACSSGISRSCHSTGLRSARLQPVLQRRDALVLVDAARRAVADRHQADADGVEGRHGGARAAGGLMNWNSSRKAARLAVLGRQAGGVAAGGAHQAAQLLAVGVGVGVHPACQRVVVGDQFGAPAFDLVQRQRLLRAAQLGSGHGFAQRRLVGAAHQLAHVLHLAAPAFVRPGARGTRWRRAGSSGMAMRSSRSWAGRPGLAQLLQVVRLLLELRLAGAVVGFVGTVAVVGVDAAVRGGASGHGGQVGGRGRGRYHSCALAGSMAPRAIACPSRPASSPPMTP